MNKDKLAISKYNLSWEKTTYKECDINNCKKEGQFKAPKSRIMLNDYFYFCLEHIKEYNKSWDFYRGLSVNEIENSVREDIIWNRPSWPLKGSPYKVMEQINSFYSNNFEDLNAKENDDYFENRLHDENLSKDENKALRSLNLKLPLTLEKIKKNYKKLVKIFHPDVNGNNKNAEETFKKINNSYRILLKKFKNEK